MNLNIIDLAMSQLIAQEEERQETTINLIASENYVSAAVMQATSSVLTNKYKVLLLNKKLMSMCKEFWISKSCLGYVSKVNDYKGLLA